MSLIGKVYLLTPLSRIARIIPAVPSGLSETLLPPLSSKVYISLLTTSEESPEDLLKSSVCSSAGVLANLNP